MSTFHQLEICTGLRRFIFKTTVAVGREYCSVKNCDRNNFIENVVLFKVRGDWKQCFEWKRQQGVKDMNFRLMNSIILIILTLSCLNFPNTSKGVQRIYFGGDRKGGGNRSKQLFMQKNQHKSPLCIFPPGSC